MTIKEIRQSKHMTQDELAEAIGCARITVARMESGRAPVSMKILQRLGQVLNLTLSEVVDVLEQNEGKKE